MLNIDLVCRPWSCHVAKAEGYEPQIRCKVERVSRSKRNAWMATVFVDGKPMSHAHCDTKYAAESKCANMMDAYTDVHYVSR